ncbi:hypothetical protein D1BOALGB6SA_4621 [Olavius sp. associated proteobacterium Delta 1]|nr:hypothetical protein D1BOALGB6SA_4621 [Olavius sp. associated proteobacterium Delta 1]
MRPYIHYIYELENGTPGKQVATITGKNKGKDRVLYARLGPVSEGAGDSHF